MNLADLIGAPYVELGREPKGWDCWGCVVWVRREIFGLPTPCAEEVFPQLAGLTQFKRADMAEALIAERQCAWREVKAAPGAVVLFKQYERRSHVGVMVNRREFIHARRGLGTGITSLTEPAWRPRLVGFFDAV